MSPGNVPKIPMIGFCLLNITIKFALRLKGRVVSRKDIAKSQIPMSEVVFTTLSKKMSKKIQIFMFYFYNFSQIFII